MIIHLDKEKTELIFNNLFPIRSDIEIEELDAQDIINYISKKYACIKSDFKSKTDKQELLAFLSDYKFVKPLLTRYCDDDIRYLMAVLFKYCDIDFIAKGLAKSKYILILQKYVNEFTN